MTGSNENTGRRSQPRSPQSSPTRSWTRHLGWIGPIVVGVAAAAFVGAPLARWGMHRLAAARLHMNTGPAPWPLPDHLAERIRAAHLPPYKNLAGDHPHAHVHVDILVNGQPVAVPALLGNRPPYAALHTHAPSGIIHLESSEPDAVFTLGQLFQLWGVRFDDRCLGSYCDGVRVYVDGTTQPGHAPEVVLKPYRELAVVVGTPPPVIPRSYDCHDAGDVEQVSCRGFLLPAP